MAFSVVSKKSGKTYYLHGRTRELKNGKKSTLYYFAGDVRDGSLDAVPDGYEVTESTHTGLPFLKRKK